MADVSKPANDSVPTTASAWLVELCENPGNRDLHVHFERWLAASPLHARDWEEIARTADIVRAAPPRHEGEWGEFLRRRKAARAAGHPLPAEEGQAVRGRPRHRLVSGLAALAAAAGLALVAGGHVLTRFGADHVTMAAEQRSLRLADGTRVVMAPESAIDVAYADDMRRVRLLRGEAFFEVAADAARPFAVSAGAVDVRDIGTAFEVSLGERATSVAVREGVVDVTANGGRVAVGERLEAGDWLRLGRAGAVERGRTSPDEIAVWTQGQLVAKSRPVADVVDALRPYFDGLIVLRGASLAAQPLTGVYNLSDPVEALRAVAQAQGASLHRLSPWLVVIIGD